ncbi:hypothetical protein LIZ91_06160 [Enterococcus avium]|uniref:hypothetical protein n=1 Tax=Enterococcus avium TaxID=33945 RepID=UPI001D095F34|nr:hypothetical protein [Enterococcus avium]MCB6916167.1 hypothetical protein [Enterococcus avium]MCQ4960024.1 hypothetical protein [Enterococcus avium]
MNGFCVLVDFGEDGLVDSFFRPTYEVAIDFCREECKKIMRDLIESGFKSRVQISKNVFVVENEDDHSTVKYLIQPLMDTKKESVLFGEEQTQTM